MIQNRHPHPVRRFGAVLSETVLSGAARAAALVLLLGALMLPPVAVQAQDRDMRSLIDQVGRLQQDLSDLQRHVYRGERPASGAAGSVPPAAAGAEGQALSNLHFRLTDLEARMAELNGRIEEASYATQRLNDRMEKLSSDIDFRLTRLEERMVSGEGAAAPAPQAPDKQGATTSRAPGGEAVDDRGPKTLGTLPQSATTGGAEANRPAQQQAALPANATPKEVYDQAFQTLVRQDFPTAEQQFKAFLDKNKNHELAGNAQYWLAETYYVRGQFEQAAVAFAHGFETYPKNAKAPDNLLKLGLSLSNLNRKQDACVAFSELTKQYPNAAQSVKRRAELERQKLKCP
ncbi:tol-pal system protein YbgF [Oceanibaculum indicum]|uniref:Cell division coordinator CpoB n=1 Tax=Oceanibaculum indicum P24 TaxID=1207063 RepID=K2JAE1_9PROT|nr:tol-pal system protein YbgF [Oceanibaculum indicum]EKE67509.1 hypothetical protein P24_18436 [Oceanibaculum indicum P24]